jgi:putative membrane-bound dehydrogenase-like protein
MGVLCALLMTSEVVTAVAAGKQLTGVYAPTASPALSPAHAQASFTVPSGFQVRLFAAEPDVINPVAMTWDERGRLWVLELYEYPLGAPAGTKPRDRIKILEDTDNDGRADKVTVFADGLTLATGLALGNGGVYVGQAPDLLFLQDTNHDDIADTRTVLLTGFGLDDRHELLNGFTWGPDGWLYMTHGVFTHSKVKIPEASAPGVEVTAAVARYYPYTKKFEVFADGTSNPWGVDFDRYGNAFVSACVIDHLFHMAPGGIYARQGGTPANPHSYELLPSIVDHKHHMAAYCGICIYQGDQFPEEYRGHVFVGNIHQNAVNHDRLSPNGSSFKATAEKDFLTTSDGWFRPVSEQVGPDGALWIADWYDKYPCYQNAQADPEGVDRERGRIWRVVYTGTNSAAKIGSRPEAAMDLNKLEIADLVKVLEHPNVWHRRMAQRILAERSSRRPALLDPRGFQVYQGLPETTGALEHLVREGKSLETRLAGLWALHVVGPTVGGSSLFSEPISWPAQLFDAAASPEPAVRKWAAIFIGELLRTVNYYRELPQNPPLQSASFYDEGMEQITRMATDPDPSVRCAVAVACREIISASLTVDADIHNSPQIGRVLAALAPLSKDAKDPLIPYMIWMAGEPAFAEHPQSGVDWLARAGPQNLPLSGILARKAMRRICDTEDKTKLDLVVPFLEKITGASDELALAALDGLIEGQKAKPLVPAAETSPLFAKLNASVNRRVKERSQELGTLWGNAASIEATLKTVNDAAASLEEREKAIAAAKVLKNQAARDALLHLLNTANPEALMIEAVRALGELGGDAVADDLLKLWPRLTPNTKAAAADVLVSRRRWTVALLSTIESKQINPLELPITAVRALGDSKDDFIRQRATQAIGRIRPANADKQQIIEQKKAMILKGGPLDLKAGHEIARKTCFVCHKLNGEGADVGPDLTGVGRSSLDALLVNVIDPNLVIGKGYENVIIEKKDGQTLTGRMVENADSRVKLLSSGPKEEIVAKSDIENMRVSDVSVMPEGLEQTLPDHDFRNLILFILNGGEGGK